MSTVQKNSAFCSCGVVTFEIVGSPIARAYCHCTICQKFNNANYADVTVFYSKDITGIDESKIEFKVYKQPPLVRRGNCTHCNSPVIEKLTIPLLPKMLIVPSTNFDDTSFLPEPRMHIFYDKRIGDINDGIKKHSGFLSSQIGFSTGLVKGMISRK
ncbi:MAG: GFA family protein [Granulosicoccus sp.]